MKRILKYCALACIIICTVIFIIFEYRTYCQVIWEVFKASFWVTIPVSGLYLFIFGLRPRFLENLIHELTHMLFSLLTLSKVNGLYVSETNGAIYTVGSERSILVSLSPYFFPILTVFLIWLFTVVDFQYDRYAVIASYTLFIVIAAKHLINEPGEITSTGIEGWLLLLILNFWSSWIVLSWCCSHELRLNEIPKIIYYGIQQILSKLTLI